MRNVITIIAGFVVGSVGTILALWLFILVARV